MTENHPPSVTVDPGTGDVGGPFTLRLRGAMQRLGWPVEFRAAPWSRAYAMALMEPGVCVYGTVRTAQREATFKWVGPIDQSQFVMVARRGSMIKLDDLEAARGYRIGVYAQDVREQMLRRMGGYRLDTTPERGLNARKLVEGRIDLWFTDVKTLDHFKSRFPGMLEAVLLLPANELFLACNVGFSDARIAAMNEAVRAVIAEAQAPPSN